MIAARGNTILQIQHLHALFLPDMASGGLALGRQGVEGAIKIEWFPVVEMVYK
jgi:hypothetical protein